MSPHDRDFYRFRPRDAFDWIAVIVGLSVLNLLVWGPFILLADWLL